MLSITMDGTSVDSMDGINLGELSTLMDYIHPAIGRDIQSVPKKGKLTL